MVKQLVEGRINKLLDELEAISNKYLVDTSELSVIQKAVISEVSKEDTLRMIAIKHTINLLGMLFKEDI